MQEFNELNCMDQMESFDSVTRPNHSGRSGCRYQREACLAVYACQPYCVGSVRTQSAELFTRMVSHMP